MRVKIKKHDYGRYSKENKEYLAKHLGDNVPVAQHNMNYWRLNNGMLLHVYDSSLTL